MLLPRLLLPLCGLLLALAVTAATASAPLYGTGEVRITASRSSNLFRREVHMLGCEKQGGSIVPMVTEAVYTLVADKLEGWSTSHPIRFHIGASTMLSSPECTTEAASLSCIWYWDEGRYAGIENAVPFYRGNRDTSVLSGAGMISTTVGNHWGSTDSSEHCPCEKMQRYGAANRAVGKPIFWFDTSASAPSYPQVYSLTYLSICAIEKSSTTATTTPANTTTTTTESPEEGSSRVNGLQVVGFSVAPAAVVIVLGVLLSLSS